MSQWAGETESRAVICVPPPPQGPCVAGGWGLAGGLSPAVANPGPRSPAPPPRPNPQHRQQPPLRPKPRGGGVRGSSSTAGLPRSTLGSSSPSGGGILAGAERMLSTHGSWGQMLGDKSVAARGGAVGGDTSSRLLNLREGSRLWLPSCPRCKRRGTGRKVINIARCHPKPSWCSPAPLTPAQPPPRHPALEPRDPAVAAALPPSRGPDPAHQHPAPSP